MGLGLRNGVARQCGGRRGLGSYTVEVWGSVIGVGGVC